jgi:epoxyqueuosine reductase QueG
MNAVEIKQIARELGADLVGIASARTLNDFPPDPRFPQVPEHISLRCKSIIVLGFRIPVAVFRSKMRAPVHYMDMLVMRRMDKVAKRLADHLEQMGVPSFCAAAQQTDFSLKKGSYGNLSFRHLGVEAGLGTLGMNVSLLTPQFGPRLYLTGVLTELELEADTPLQEQVCLGEGCARCLHACPTDAVRHFGIDKRACSIEAQESGFGKFLGVFSRFIPAPREEKKKMLRSRDFFGLWQSMVHVSGAFGGCPCCMTVCPIGDDYHAYLAKQNESVLEKSRDRVAKVGEFKSARRRGSEVPGLNKWNIRWVGPAGYSGEAVKAQRQRFKSLQIERGQKEDPFSGDQNK